MTDVTSKRKTKSTLKMDILKCFGADFQTGIKSPLKFAGEIGNSIIYPFRIALGFIILGIIFNF